MKRPSKTRMQRTGSSPSALRSPLMRWPSGLLGMTLVLGALGVTSCASSANQQSPSPQFQLPAGCSAQPQNTDPEVTPPRISQRVEPKISRSDPSPAYACLEAVVQVDGTLKDVKVVKTSGTAMTTEALAAVREWKYVPATRNGVAIPLSDQYCLHDEHEIPMKSCRPSTRMQRTRSSPSTRHGFLALP